MPSPLKREVMQRLQGLTLQLMNNPIIITDPDGVVIWANRAFTELTGYTMKDVERQYIWIPKSGEEDSSHYEQLWSTIKSGNAWSGILDNHRKDGSIYFMETIIHPVLDDNGVITNYILFIQNISMKADETHLIQPGSPEEPYNILRARARSIIDATSEAMLFLSTNKVVILINRAFERYFALIEEEFLGHPAYEIFPHIERVFEDSSKIIRFFEESSYEDDVDYRVTVIQKWPLKRDIEIYSTLVKDVNEEQIGRLYVFRDVTREREMERMQSEFVSLVSHELRTPLTSIVGYVDMMLDGDVGELNESQIDFLMVVKRNSERLTILVMDLLDVSRIESGAIKLKWETLDVKQLIRDVVKNLRPQFSKKKQRLYLNLDEENSMVFGDPGRLNQVLTNLLSNAHKYTPEGGEIRVVTEQEDTWIRIDIIDNGIGLSDEDQERLFTKFFRSDDPSIRAIGGSGLGLWLSKAFVEMFGGVIKFQSKFGVGSTFSIHLPVKN